MPGKRGSVHRHPALSEPQTQAILKLVGKPLKMTGQTQATDLEKLALLAGQLQKRKFPHMNPFKSDFSLFRRKLVFTKDEAAGGWVRQLPDYDYFYDIDDALLSCPLLLIEKSRRVLASWVVCAFDLWLIAGGTDPRWPSLMQSSENRKVIVGSQKLEGEAGSAWFVNERIQYIYQQFEERGLREFWPDFPEMEWKFGYGKASNGGVISAIAQGANQARGPGATFCHFEEMAFWSDAQATVEAAIPMLRGGGHMCAITTACANSYASRIVHERLKSGGW